MIRATRAPVTINNTIHPIRNDVKRIRVIYTRVAAVAHHSLSLDVCCVPDRKKSCAMLMRILQTVNQRSGEYAGRSWYKRSGGITVCGTAE
ncbi:hypothetical protein KCP69_03745 [Salmonella enterica subsp. enterica]|nr:hypothetical protein KCP69_03745 [Salmonella enterica subsp. enterica]